MKVLIICLLLGIALAQTNFNNTCQNDSLIYRLATGTINLNPLDTYNNGANKDYYQSLSLAQFYTTDVLGYGFSLTGFQTSCSNTYYTLIVDKIAFENENTRMRVVVNFRNPGDGSITLWTMVSFSYIVVSRNLNGAYSDVWATVAQITNPVDGATASVDRIGVVYNQAVTATTCSAYTDPFVGADTTGCQNNIASVAGSKFGGKVLVHSYIMGFMYNPVKTLKHYLQVGIKPTLTAPGVDQNLNAITYATSPSGPQLTITNLDAAVEYIKVAFVITRVASTPATNKILPSGSGLLYSSSQIYTPVTTFNTPVVLKQGTAANEFNRYYYHLPDTRYAIYGIHSFDLPRGSNISCATIMVNSTLNNIDSYTVTTPNTNPTSFMFSADIFTVNIDKLCNPDSTNNPISAVFTTVGAKNFFTVPTMSLQQFIIEQPVPITTVSTGPTTLTDPTPTAFTDTFDYTGFFRFNNYATPANNNTDRILFQTSIPFIGLTPGAPLKFEFAFYDDPALPATGYVGSGNDYVRMIKDQTYFIQLAVNGFILYQTNYVAVYNWTPAGITLPDTYVGQNGDRLAGFPAIIKGITANGTTANVVITVAYNRSITLSQNVWTELKVTQYNKAYDPTTGCCVSGCPSLTGVDVQNDPPVCIYCNTNAGLIYNPNNGTCTCNSGFYLDSTKTYQCYACTALYCSICNPANPAQCTTCVVGANINNVSQTCTCGNGYYVQGTQCVKCPYQCQNCTSPNGACIACVDSIRRDRTQNCKCITGFFDSGALNCTACSPTCLTCTNSSACTSCDATKFRNLTSGTLCTCIDGYYELYGADQSRVCTKCNPECLTCTSSPANCLKCDPKKNRVPGVGPNGVSTCLCQPGYYSTPDGSCIQSNCNADPFCATCQQGLKLCIQCQASLNRIIKLPESICVCTDGFYANSNNTCVACPTGCGICSSATNCTACVALATPNGNGSCSCPSQTYFAVSDGARYCAACSQYCQTCVDATTCTTCLPSYTKTADNKCICGDKSFIDFNSNCIPCATGCQKCISATVCNSCISPLILQGSTCQVTCNNGFTIVGAACVGCPTGCLQCTQNLQCYYCADGYYMYNGGCYTICPAGTVGDKTGGNWNCVPCNSPCKTCINHPSYCTSCLNGMGYLQTSAVQQSCVLSCVDGTYVSNGVCLVCDFRCATCIGSATNCVSCPAGQVLYNGGCWATCPAISFAQDGMNATCTDSCPAGFWKVSVTQCAPCAAQCTTCDGSATNCTSCLQGSVSINGTCTVSCGENQFSFSGICVDCSPSCYGCQYTPQNCLQCASGYVRTGSICQRGCLSYQFFDSTQQKCISCGPSCATCTSYSYCTTCQNAAITPRGGVCSNCPYPCNTCDATGTCTSCLSGFYFFQGACQTTCPSGALPVNGVCQCSSGIISNGQCVTSCGSGFTSIGGSCQPCNSNCAQCSGSIDRCTSCIGGFTLDANSFKCVSVALCPYGQDISSGVCINICDQGFYYYEGICIYGGCFSGYIPNSFGGCVRQAGSTATQKKNTPTCNQNQFIANGQCVGSCPSGYYGDTNSRQCLTCPNNCISCFNSNFCVVCASGYQASNGVCSATSACPNNQFQYNGLCINSCPVGTSSSGSQCLRSCPANSYYLSQICYMSCPTNLRTNEACVTNCPAGTTNKNGVCA